MRKLFSFRSSSSSNVINDRAPPPAPPDNEEVYWEAPFKFGDNTQLNKTLKQIPERQNLAPCTGLRRSLSFSSASYIGSPMNNGNMHAQSDDILVGCRSRTPDRHSKAKRSEGLAARNKYGLEKVESPCSSNSIDSKRDSAHGSPQPNSARLVHVSNNVLDLYIDGEQNQDMNLRKRSSSFRCQSNIAVGGRRPPRIQTTAPVSPTDMRKDKGRSPSFRDNHLRLSTREWKRTEFGSESPQKLARNVVERLSQVFPHKPKTRSRDLNPDTPTTVEDIFESFVDPNPSSYSDVITQKNCVSDTPYDTMTGYVGDVGKDFSDERFSTADASVSMYLDKEDVELHKYADEAQERVMCISEEIEQDTLLRSRDFSVSELFQTIRSLSEEKRSLAEEVLTQIQCRISERESAREAHRGAMVEIDSRTRRLEREKNELQTTLEQELDRRSSDWSFKLEKYQLEEQRLRERVRELAEQNVSLQREVSSSNVKEAENRNQMANAEVQLKDLTAKLEETTKENCALRQNLSKLHDQCKGAENDRDCIRQSYKATEKEIKELQKTVARLQRTCSEQERMIKGLRQGLAEDAERKEPFDYDANRWKMEQVRLTGVEQVLRREVESYRLEVESIRRENMNLLDRLNNSGIEGGSAGFRLEQELKDRIFCLQKQGLSLFDESCLLCEKLLGFFNGKTDKSAGKIQEVGKDGYFIVEANMKVQNMKRGIESLTRSLQSISLVLEEKSNTENDSSGKLKDKASEDDIAFKLKAETLLTTLLREKLLSKQQEVEQLQAEVATAARGHDILRSEVQGALDSLSRASHKMKDLELKLMKKEDTIHQLTSELQQCEKELASVKGVLSKMTEERDLCWDEVKNYSEKNMLLNSEVNMLRKKVESLDEDVHIKEGQITILRDSLGNRKPFDILYSPNSMQEMEHF
ncbi:early endosome antigen 1-like [Papaver somniferum]|uniref:early endosome antigen 1-like n=1 Tax=Papaver somniferum TaxID=3469 RepID=UPI000E705819|nr:early endosome antigen 1-like [Papaver somniferum]XP_026430625.1 early endosome antigen 1-like [Papaver somniferum]